MDTGATANSSANANFGNLGSVGPVVVLNTTTLGANARALVMLTSQMSSNDPDLHGVMGFEVSGPGGFVLSADNSRSLIMATGEASNPQAPFVRPSGSAVVTLGAPGVYTFTAKYRVQHSPNDASKTAEFSNREMIVSIFP